MESVIYQDLPDLSTGVLVDMGGWPVLREARSLVESGAVRSVDWQKPILKAEIIVGEAKFFVLLNLRSTAFTENQCNCPTGIKGYVCSHAIAACIAAVRKREESEKAAKNPQAKKGGPRENPVEHAAPAKPLTPTSLYTFEVDALGKPLECRIVLPPNLADSAPRNMMVLKLELLFEGRRNPPERLFKGARYKLDAQTLKALCLVEAWNHGKLAGLLQLKRDQLRALLDTLKGMPVFEWASVPNRPIAWTDGKLSGVSELVAEAESKPVAPVPVTVVEKQKAAPPPRPAAGIQVRRSSGVITARQSSILDNMPKPAPRNTGLFREREEAEGDGRMHIDGSPHFLAIQIPPHDHPMHSRARTLLELNNFHLEPVNARWWLRERHKVLNFLAEHGDELDRIYAPVYTDNYKERMLAVKRAKVVAQATAEKGGAFLLNMRIEAGPLGEEDIRRSLASRQYYVLSGESIWLLPPAQLARMAEAQSALSGQPGQPLMPAISRRLSGAQLCDAEDVVNGVAEEIETPQQWKSRVSALKNIANLQAPPIPKTLDDQLRGYQRIGAAWLWHLSKSELGGVLADEMGLGKTVQAVALLASLKARSSEHVTSLVVCPAGLVENWMRECKRFAPELKVKRHHGAARIADAGEIKDCDIVITSYQTLVRDSELFITTEFATIIADEAQHIKNRRTQAAVALRSLHASSRFVLTGTPVENSLDDLRSIFAFILPGYLSRIPDGVRGEERAWFDKRHLKQAVPYILRRSKKLVAPELPAKIEQTVYCELSPNQSKLYNDLREQGQKAIFEMEMGGASDGKLRFEAFTRLLRLRQTCVDPRILKPAFEAADSAKLRALEEILNEAIDGGHRLLVFSQFVEALKLISEMLREKELPYAYIDGSTTNRQKECDRFNEDDSIPVFLISLKAGGTGLNLTGADMVVHFDPWWNPAVEAQATDRAHRIGQTRTVTSIKLIAADTVEEKVLELQRTKAKILEELLDESAAQTSKISLSDLKSLIG